MRSFLFLLLVGYAGSLSAQITDTAQKIIPGRVNSPQQEKKPYGFDNALPEMGATFYAWGPAFRHLTIPAFENVNVYPLIAHLLGLTLSGPVDGSLGVLNETLKK